MVLCTVNDMAVCLCCGQISKQPGELCSCGKAYMVCDNQQKDQLGLLGQLVAGKFVPIALIKADKSTLVYEMYQLVVDRKLTLTAILPKVYAKPGVPALVKSFIDNYANVKQQNTPTLLEVIELNELKTLAVTTDAFRGDVLPEYQKNNQIEAIEAIHIIHQMLQATAALHRNHLRMPHIGPDNVRIIRSGHDHNFVRLRGLLEATLTHDIEKSTPRDDVADVAQIALSILTERPLPVSSIELPPDRSYLMPIVQLFLAAESNYESCTEMLNAFETAFDLNTRDYEKVKPANVSDLSTPPSKPKNRTPVPFDQIIWMHRPPQSDF